MKIVWNGQKVHVSQRKERMPSEGQWAGSSMEAGQERGFSRFSTFNGQIKYMTMFRWEGRCSQIWSWCRTCLRWAADDAVHSDVEHNGDDLQANFYDLMVCFTKWPRNNILDKVSGVGSSYRCELVSILAIKMGSIKISGFTGTLRTLWCRQRPRWLNSSRCANLQEGF